MIKDTVAPIPMEELKEYFNDDSIIFNIDYSESILKEDKLITYVSNLDIPCNIVGWDKVSLADRKNYILVYMNHRLIINSVHSELTVLKMLYQEAGFEWIDEIYDIEYILNDDEMAEFRSENPEIINRWLTAIASGSVFNVTTINDEAIREAAKNEFETIDDYDYIGVNYVKMYEWEEAQAILALDIPVYYMEKQFNEPMFKGKNMFYYWTTPNNFMAMLTYGVSSGEIIHEDFQHQMQKELEYVSAL